MGIIYYGGSATPITIEDRALAHLKVVIATKLRRNESFTVSWQHPEGEPVGRSTLWMHPSIPLRFVFDEADPPELSRQWIEDLANSANSTGGIQLIAEQVVTTPADGDVTGDRQDSPRGTVDAKDLDAQHLRADDADVPRGSQRADA